MQSDISSRPVDVPLPGFYRLRLVRGGPWMPAAITHDAAGEWAVYFDGAWYGPARLPWSLPNMERVALYGLPIDEAGFLYLIARRRHAEVYAPDSPAADPRKPVNLDKLVPF